MTRQVTEESILNLVVQSLHRYGPMPIGEIGKQLQVMAQNPGSIPPFLFSFCFFFSNLQTLLHCVVVSRFPQAGEKALWRIEKAYFFSFGVIQLRRQSHFQSHRVRDRPRQESRQGAPRGTGAGACQGRRCRSRRTCVESTDAVASSLSAFFDHFRHFRPCPPQLILVELTASSSARILRRCFNIFYYFFFFFFHCFSACGGRVKQASTAAAAAAAAASSRGRSQSYIHRVLRSADDACLSCAAALPVSSTAPSLPTTAISSDAAVPPAALSRSGLPCHWLCCGSSATISILERAPSRSRSGPRSGSRSRCWSKSGQLPEMNSES